MNRPCLVLFLSMISAPLHADSYAPFVDFRQVEPTGRYYLVVKKLLGNPEDPGRGTAVEFTLAETKPGAPPPPEVEDERYGFRQVKTNPEVKVREGDRIVGRGEFERVPSRIRISSTGLGFIGLDVRGYNFGDTKSPNAMVIVAPNGTIRHRKCLKDLFSHSEIASFMVTAGGMFWAYDGWIDEKRREAVVIGWSRGNDDEEDEKKPKRYYIRVVNLDTGNVRLGSPEDFVTAVAERNRGGLDVALDLVAELKLASARPHLPKHFDDGSLPLESRLRAAVALAVFGDRRGEALMAKSSLEKGPAQLYAVEHLPDLLGNRAAPVLCEAIRRNGEVVHTEAWQAMKRVDAAAAVPALIQLLNDRKSPDGMDYAAECLGDKGPAAKAAIPDLIRLINDRPQTERPDWTVRLAVMALGEIGPDAKESLPLLRKLERESYQAYQMLSLAKKKNSRVPFNDPIEDELWSLESFNQDAYKAIRRIEKRP